MYTKEQIPWVEYLEIDKTTLETKLRKNAPKEIKEAYQKYLEEMKEYKKKNLPISK